MNPLTKVRDALSRPSELESRQEAVREAENEANEAKRLRRELTRETREARKRDRIGEERRLQDQLRDVDREIEAAEEAVEEAREDLRAHVAEEAGPEALERLQEAERAYRDKLEPFGRTVAERFAEVLEARATYRAARSEARELAKIHRPIRGEMKAATGQAAEPAEILGLAALRALRPLVVNDEPLGELWAETGLDVRDGSFVRGSPLNRAETLRAKNGTLPI